MRTVDHACQQRGIFASLRHLLRLLNFTASLLRDALGQLEQVLVDNLQLGYKLRAGRLGVNVAHVALVVEDPQNVVGLEFRAAMGADSPFIEHLSQSVGTVALIGRQLK